MSLVKINNIIDIENNTYKFNDKNITITYDEYNNVWFKGKDVCDILKYKNSNDAIKKHVENEDKIEYEKLTLYGVAFRYPIQFDRTLQNQTIYINESGLYSLVLNIKNLKKKFYI